MDISDRPAPRFWWVNQGSTFDEGRDRGLIWAPQRSKSGRMLFHWENVARVRAGDVILHYADGAVRAVSLALSNGHEAPRTTGDEPDLGWQANVDLHPLKTPLPIVKIGRRLTALALDRGPVNRAGAVNPGYLFELPPSALSIIAAQLNAAGLPPGLAAKLEPLRTSYNLRQTDLPQLLPAFAQAVSAGNFVLDAALLLRYAAALLAKRFVILTGPTGSGKTRLAQAFARWLTPHEACYSVIAVGADWTNRDPVLGYVDQLNDRYVRTTALDVLLHATDDPDTPHFLILDEMNLAHVERYFSDLLSALESGEPIQLHNQPNAVDGVPPQLPLPSNVFIVGTVNIDETAHLFSPKVLDRANVIEFQINSADMQGFLQRGAGSVALDVLNGEGAGYGRSFVDAANSEVALPEAEQQQLSSQLLNLFETLQPHGLAFGFRAAKEMTRFVALYRDLQTRGQPDTVLDKNWLATALDAQILQKVLPRLSGSRSQLAEVLAALAEVCDTGAAPTPPSTSTSTSSTGRTFRERRNTYGAARYPRASAKIARMWHWLEVNGFVSFMEAG